MDYDQGVLAVGFTSVFVSIEAVVVALVFIRSRIGLYTILGCHFVGEE